MVKTGYFFYVLPWALAGHWKGGVEYDHGVLLLVGYKMYTVEKSVDELTLQVCGFDGISV